MRYPAIWMQASSFSSIRKAYCHYFNPAVLLLLRERSSTAPSLFEMHVPLCSLPGLPKYLLFAFIDPKFYCQIFCQLCKSTKFWSGIENYLQKMRLAPSQSENAVAKDTGNTQYLLDILCIYIFQNSKLLKD